jgi:type VI secretion system protein ImpG
MIIRDPESDGPAATVTLERDFLGEVGYEKDEGLLPYDNRSFLGYRLLQEFFCFPQKFLFFDVRGFERLAHSPSGRLDVIILLNEFSGRDRFPQLERSVNKETFLLGCTPAVNLFERHADSITVTETVTEYRVVADRYHETSTEVYSIESVISSRPDTEEIVQYEPFYSFRHSYVPKPRDAAFWIANRRDSFRKDDNGTEVYLALVDLGFRPTVPPAELLTLRVKCTNRDLPAKLPITGAVGEFEMTSGPMVRVRCRHRPTETVRPKYRRGLQWRLVSHLALNGLSIIEGREAFQELLKLYDFTDDPVIRRQIEGITSVTSSPHVARVTSDNGVVMCTGTRVEMEFDEDQFVGSSAFLMGGIIERFLALYSSVNSFSQLVAKSRQRKGLLKQWPPRPGEQILL